MTEPSKVNIETHSDAGVSRVAGPFYWPWPLPRPDDVVQWGSPARRATVDHVRYEMDSGQVVIVCDRWPS